MKFLKDKRFRYGTFSTVMMLFAIVVFVLVNLVAGEFNRFRDLTNEQIFTLSSQSIDFLAELDEDVVITTIARTGNEHPIISTLLDEYSAASSYITVHTRDPMLTPALIHQLAADAGMEGGIPEFSVVVESRGNIRVVTPMQMVQQEIINPFTMQTRVVSFNFESEITRAIHFVTQGEPSVVYYIVGSGEMPLDPILIMLLEHENFIVREVNLITDDVPEDADILFIPTPSRDWPANKSERISQFLANDGRAFFAMEFSQSLENVNAVLSAYGVEFGANFLMEGDTRNMLGNPLFILPNVVPHEITEDAIAIGFINAVAFSIPILPLELRAATTVIEPLWITSRDAFARVDTQVETLQQVPGDIPGPFILAAAITHRNPQVEASTYTQMVLIGSNGFLDSGLIENIGPGNWQFVLNSLRWLRDQPPSIFVPGRVPPGQAQLLINERQANIFAGVAMGVIPVVIIAAGAAVWFKRRHS